MAAEAMKLWIQIVEGRGNTQLRGIIGSIREWSKTGDWETRRRYPKITVAKREAFAKKRPPHREFGRCSSGVEQFIRNE